MRSYLTITKDLGRVMTRVKAIYRSWAIPCSGKQVYAPRHRAEWLGKIGEPGVLGIFSGGGRRVLETLWFESESQPIRLCVLRASSLTPDPRPSRITRKSYGPRVPERTMVANLTTVLLCWFRNRPASLRTSDENRW